MESHKRSSTIGDHSKKGRLFLDREKISLVFRVFYRKFFRFSKRMISDDIK